MAIYTKKGDQGETFLADGKKVPKHSLRVSAYGEIDELNALIGLIRVYVHQENYQKILDYLQNILFTIGSDLATEKKELSGIPRLQTGEVEKLEKWIDELDADLPQLKNFILPGGNVVAAYLHLARAVCRRAERAIVSLQRAEKINPEIEKFINRLSSLFFVLARHVNHASGVNEELWSNPLKKFSKKTEGGG